MQAIRTAGLCVALISAAAMYAAAAEYLGGTVKSVPSATAGRLDLSDPTDLIFVYGKGVYRLPYARIKNFQWEHAKASSRHVLGRLQVPRAPWGKQDEILNLSYRTDENETGVLSFKVTSKDPAATEWALKSRVQDPGAAALAQRAKLPESWWGDKYWRTNRNASTWASAESETAGTK